MMNLPSILLFLVLGVMTGPGYGPRAVDHEPAEPPGEELPSGKSGSIEGRVFLVGTVPSKQKLIIVKDRDVCGRRDHYDERLVVGKGDGIRNSVVSLAKKIAGKPAASMGTRFVVDQKDCSYSPRIVLVPVNKELTILNSDGLLHNIHTFSTKNPPVNIAQTKFQKELKLKFAFPERVKVTCDIHGWMSAWFVVADHPYYSLTNEEGKFSLNDVPPGVYTLNSWHEVLGEQTADVTVEAGSVARVEFKYSVKK